MECISQSTDRWMSLPISLIERINILKINILRKLIYLFQNIPLVPPTHIFLKMKKLFPKFLWNAKHPKIHLSLIYPPSDGAGLKYPNLLWYYWAIQLRTLVLYFSADPPVWMNMESYSIDISLHFYMHSAGLEHLRKHIKNPILSNMIMVWFKVKKKSCIYQVLCPVLNQSGEMFHLCQAKMI